MPTTYGGLLRKVSLSIIFPILIVSCIWVIVCVIWSSGNPSFLDDPISRYYFLFGLLTTFGSAFGFVFWDLCGASIAIPLLPRWWAVRTPRCQQSLQDANLEGYTAHICTGCDDALRRSRLLTGTRWIFTASTEWHDFRHLMATRAEGVNSRCHLCTLLLDSVQSLHTDLTGTNTAPSMTTYGTFSAQTLSGETDLKLKIYQPLEEEGSTYLQLHSNGRFISKAFSVRKGENNTSPLKSVND